MLQVRPDSHNLCQLVDVSSDVKRPVSPHMHDDRASSRISREHVCSDLPPWQLRSSYWTDRLTSTLTSLDFGTRPLCFLSYGALLQPQRPRHQPSVPKPQHHWRRSPQNLELRLGARLKLSEGFPSVQSRVGAQRRAVQSFTGFCPGQLFGAGRFCSLRILKEFPASQRQGGVYSV